MTLQTSVYQVIQRHSLIPPRSTVVIGVSGGADSLALLHILIALKERLECNLHVATLDHGLRGQAGAEDAVYVEQVCGQWGVPCTRERHSVTDAMRKHQMGVEEAARFVRYRFLRRAAEKVGSDRVAVAHHADDQAETVLMHILRGSGVNGLIGMDPMARYPIPGKHLILIRPLLLAARAEIEAYCAEHMIVPRHDATNDDVDYTRNRIRHVVMPALRTVNPAVHRALSRMREIARLENDYMEREFERHVLPHTRYERDHAGTRTFDEVVERYYLKREVIYALDEALRRRFFLYALGKLGIDPDYELIVRAVEVARWHHVGATVVFSQTARLRIDYDEIIVENDPRAAQPAFIPTIHEMELPVPGHVEVPRWRIYAQFDAPRVHHARLVVPDKADIRLRNRQRGDRFAPLGLGGHTQKLSEWLIDHKVPQRYRDQIPLITVNGEIAAIVWGDQWTISENFAVKPDSERVVYFWIEHKP